MGGSSSSGSSTCDSSTVESTRATSTVEITLPDSPLNGMRINRVSSTGKCQEQAHRVCTLPEGEEEARQASPSPQGEEEIRQVCPLPQCEEGKASKKILVVDDSLSITKTMSRQLQLRGYDVDVARNGHEGLHKLLAHHQEYCLVFSDLEMPVMDGSEMVSTFRKWEQKQLNCEATSPLFICSMSSNFEKQDNLRDTNPTQYNVFVRKPMTQDKIDSVLCRRLKVI
jgi:CheY-like chemotaxis protein